MKEFLEILKYESQEINTKFLRSSIEGKSTSQEVSDFREHAVQEFVQRYYPFPYRISKGGIYDSYGERSDSIDCLILNPNHPHTVNSHGKHSLIVADGVDVAMEVKPDISNKSELTRALVQGLSVKKLRRRVVNTVLEYDSEVLDISKRIPYFVFSMKAKASIQDTFEEIKQFYDKNDTPLVDQADVFVILNRGLIINYKHANLYPWNLELAPESKTKWYFEEWGEHTLAGLLFNLNRVYGAAPTIIDNYLKYYLMPGNVSFNALD
ncbi:DUF6602 domain-containing protein [Priestia megaterium]|uniref:DUF6602 domain-containing protein n=1 Tax=Priestia megaterium TaxID=1404 RepID=UPI00387A1DD3